MTSHISRLCCTYIQNAAVASDRNFFLKLTSCSAVHGLFYFILLNLNATCKWKNENSNDLFYLFLTSFSCLLQIFKSTDCKWNSNNFCLQCSEQQIAIQETLNFHLYLYSSYLLNCKDSGWINQILKEFLLNLPMLSSIFVTVKYFEISQFLYFRNIYLY